MSDRKSINLDNLSHKNPIPAAARIANFVVSSAVTGKDSVTGEMPADIAAQCANMFDSMRRIVEAAGGSTRDIINVNVRMPDRTQRPAVNVEWVKMFPDPDSRPARHTTQAELDGGQLVQCDFMAILSAFPNPSAGRDAD